MPSSRMPIPRPRPSHFSSAFARGRLYSHGDTRSRLVDIRTIHDNGDERTFECVEDILGPRLYIHDCLVDVIDNFAGRHRFKLFFTRHVLHPTNRCLMRLGGRIEWRGEILVMRLSKTNPRRVVHVRRGDGTLAEKAIARLAIEIARRTRIPKTLLA